MWTIYRHTKGMLYLKIGTALHSESCEPHEVYRTLYNNNLSSLWIRPYEMFHEELAAGKLRFAEVGKVRVVTPQDEATVLAFGYDAWGQGASLDEFIANYALDRNHIRGVRYLFELPGGEIVANLNTLRFARGLIGIASLSVHLQHRRKGYGTILVRAVMELLRLEDAQVRFMLFSEVDPKIYEKLGFNRLSSAVQLHLPSVAMATGSEPLSEQDLLFVKEYF